MWWNNLFIANRPDSVPVKKKILNWLLFVKNVGLFWDTL